VPAAKAGDTVEIILNRSPFYAEAGGQLGDHGLITAVSGQSRIEVYDVQTPVPGLFLHRGHVVEGEFTVGGVRDRFGGHRAQEGDFACSHRNTYGASGFSREVGGDRDPNGI